MSVISNGANDGDTLCERMHYQFHTQTKTNKMINKILNLSFEEYGKIPRMNASTLVKGYRRIGGTMRKLKRSTDGVPNEPSKAMMFGNKYHSLILEPQSFRDAYCVMPNFAMDFGNVDAKGKPSTSWATSWCKEQKTQFDAVTEKYRKEVITRDDYDSGMEMRNSIAEKTRAMELLDQCAKEVTLFGEIDGMEFKARLDLMGDRVIADLKGTRSVIESKFGNDAARLGYGFKLAIYREIARQVTGEVLPVEIIAVESAGDFDCVVYTVPEAVLDEGLTHVRKVIAEYRECERTGRWTGVDKGADTLPLYWPNWAMDDADDLIDWSE